jgi:hypothetical protein
MRLGVSRARQRGNASPGRYGAGVTDDAWVTLAA